jgi:uncharacterized protein (UPF0264 family)
MRETEHSPKLLVSVRNAAEALVALDGGAAFIDIKEPRNGSLGQAPRDVQGAIVDTVSPGSTPPPRRDRQVVLTAALGEWASSGPPSSWVPLPGISLYKLGLSGCHERPEWTEGLDAWRERAGLTGADLVAVAYADHASAGSPEPRRVLDYAIDRQLPYFLIDTFMKTAGTLTELLDERALRSIVEHAQTHGVGVALAGSLRLEDLRAVASLGTDVIAVRGAACRQGRRELDLDADRIEKLVGILRGGSPCAQP